MSSTLRFGGGAADEAPRDLSAAVVAAARPAMRSPRRSMLIVVLASELVLCLHVDLASFQWPREHGAIEAERRAEEARIALGEAERVGQVGALRAQLPVLADIGDHAEVERVVSAEVLQAGNVLGVVADMRIGHERG